MSSQISTSSESLGKPNASDKLDRGLLAIAGVVVLGAIMSILDTTVVNATGYTLALATVIPISGWAADRFGTKRLYMLSIVLFVGGSALSGVSWSAASLIGFRILQGLGGGMLMPAAMTILTRAAGPHRLGRVMSIIGVPMLVGPILGPILGGWLVDDVSWRWIFFINVPVGAFALLASQRILPRDESTPGERFDTLGLLLLSPSLALIIYGLAQSTSHGFASGNVLLPMLVGLALLTLFVVHELRRQDPLIDLSLFTNKTFSSASLTLILVVISVFGAMLLMPLYFQAARGESALQSGLLLVPQGFGAMLAMPVAGQLADRTGVARIVMVGLGFVVLSALGLTQLAGATSYWLIGALLFLMGIGMGCSMMPIMSGAMETLRRAAIARASTTLNIIQQVGASIGTAVMTVLLTSALKARLPEAGASGGLGKTGANLPEHVRNLMGDAFGHTYWWAVGFLVVALLSAMLLPWRKPKPAEEDAAAHAAGEHRTGEHAASEPAFSRT